MKHSKRRQKAGEMLMDVCKYLLTIGLIGGILTDKVSMLSTILITVSATATFIIAFFTIPPEKEK